MRDSNRRLLRTGRFEFRSPALLFPRLSLCADTLELHGWQLTGRYRREVPLSRVLQVDTPEDDLLLIWLSIGETLQLRVAQAKGWKAAIEAQQNHLQNSTSNHRPAEE